MKKFKIPAIIAGALVLILIIGGILFHQNYLILDGQIYDRDVAVLDLSGKPLGQLDELESLSALKELDLRDTGLTVGQYEQLRKALPDCRIQWLLPFQTDYLPLDTQSITVETLTIDDIALLSYLPQLQSVDATGCRDYDAILALKEKYPQVQVSYVLQLEHTQLKEDTVSFKSADIDDIRYVLRYLPQLEEVDATDCTDFDALASLKQQYPNCTFRYEVPFCGWFWPADTTHLDINAAKLSDVERILPYLTEINAITIAEPVEDPESVAAFVADHPDIQVSVNIDLCGRAVAYDATLADLSGVAMTDFTELESKLHLFPNLEKVDMCGCGFSDEEMADLNARYPDTLFVWEVQIAYFKVRTDVTYFMPYQYRFVFTDDVVDKLKYLTEVICIDFGHAEISRTDFLAYMPKLQYLLMCDTDVWDISYCANMKDLKYVELFMTKVTDFSPLLQCKNLVDLNISYTSPKDPLIFAQMPWLENLWFRGYFGNISEEALREALPNTTIVCGNGSSTAKGWRKLPNYYAQRDLMGMPYMLED